jgi:hypothetical protein
MCGDWHHGHHGQRCHHRHEGPHDWSAPCGRAAGGLSWDAKAIFACLDKNKDGKLSFEEFSDGLRQFRQKMAQRHPGGPWAAGVKGKDARPPHDLKAKHCGHEGKDAKPCHKGPPPCAAAAVCPAGKKAPEAKKCDGQKSHAAPAPKKPEGKKPSGKPDAKKSAQDSAPNPTSHGNAAKLSSLDAVLAACGRLKTSALVTLQETRQSAAAVLATLDGKCERILAMLPDVGPKPAPNNQTRQPL